MTAVTLELEQMRRMLSTRGGGLSHIERNVHALIRRQFVDHTTLPFPHSILAQRFHIRSQNEEDGITLALIDLAGDDQPALSRAGGRHQRRQFRVSGGNLWLDRVDGRRQRGVRCARCPPGLHATGSIRRRPGLPATT